MKLYTDDYFHIGASHLGSGQPCQDYALSRALEDGSMAYAIVSDGCSKGGRTDVGSRVIAHTAEVAIRDHWRRREDVLHHDAIDEIHLQQQMLRNQACFNLGLAQNDLLATSMYAYASSHGGFVHLRGDGVIAFTYADKSMTLLKVSWAKNMPLYPAYSADEYDSFIRAHGGSGALALAEEYWNYSVEEGFVFYGEHLRQVSEGLRGIAIRWTSESCGRDLKYIVLMSDGVTQVDGVDWKDAVLSLVSFKSTAGSFAKRRMISFIKDAQKKGKGPLDDIAYAVIRVGTEEEKENG